MQWMNWGAAGAIFAASAVEWVEAFTIVLAVALSIGWARAASAAACALAAVLALIGASALGLRFVAVDMNAVRGVIGLFLLLFGLRWYVKAVRRYAGRTALHDEAEEFRETREALDHAELRAAWLIAFKGVPAARRAGAGARRASATAVVRRAVVQPRRRTARGIARADRRSRARARPFGLVHYP